MSSLPGYTLEAFLMWNYDLIVEDDNTANPSLQIAEALGMKTRRCQVSRAQFAPLVAMHEHHRGMVERRLEEFDPETQSWRDYAGWCFDFTDDVDDAALALVRAIKESPAA